MKAIAENARGLSDLVTVNIDRFLVPLVIVGALTVAGWVLSYATVY